MMNVMDYIKYRLDKTIDMCRDNTSSKDNIALYLRNFEKDLYGREK